MITEVKLKNWRSHLESELKFSLGTNALLGILGSGKSSILDGICFSLFGTFPNLQSRKLKLDDLIMKKPIEKDKAEIEVSFQINDKQYSVKRIIEKNKGTTYSEIRENGKLLEAPNTSRVTEIIEKLLKINYELFSKAIYSEQNALDYFLIIPKGQRMKKIDELLAIDRFEKARVSSVSLVNKLAERMLGKQSIVEQTDLDQLQKNISELTDSLRILSTERESLKKNLESGRVERTNLEKEVSEMKKVKEQMELLKRDEKGFSSAIDETTKALERVETELKGLDRSSIEKNINQLGRVLKDADRELSDKHKRYQKLQEQMAKSQAELELMQKEKLQKLQSELDEKVRIKKEFEYYKKQIGEDVKKTMKEKEQLFEKITSEIEATRARIEDLQEIAEQVSSIGGKCPICNSKLTAAKKKLLIRQKRSQIKLLKENLENASKRKVLTKKEVEELKSVTERLDNLLKELENFDAIRVELENSKNIYAILNENATKLSAELANLARDIIDSEKKMKTFDEQKKQFELIFYQLREYEERKNRINILMKDRQAILSHISEMEKAVTGDKLEELESWLMNLVGKEKESAMKVIGIESLIQEKEVRLKDFENTFAAVTKERNEIRKLEKLITGMKIFSTALEKTQIEMRTEFISSVNYTMNKLWQTLYPYQDFTGIRLAVEEGDYILQMQERSSKWVNVEGIASGGERSIAALALRIAFALVLAPQMRMLFLDEPTSNLDRQAISVLATTLRERIGEFIDQTFLITHQEELEEAVTGNAYRLVRDKSKEDVTKVVPLS